MKKNTLIWILRKVRRRIPSVLLLTFSNICRAVCGVLFALGSRSVIDTAVAGNMDDFGRACLFQGMVILGILFFLTISRHKRDMLYADLEFDWKRDLLHGLLHGDYAAVSGYHSAELLNRMNNDVAKVNDGVLAIIPTLASMLTRVAAAICVLGILDSRFALLICVFGAIAVAATAAVRRNLKDLNKKVSEYDGRVSGHIQETLEKILIVQAMDVAEEVELRSDKLLKQRYGVQKKRKNVSLMTNMAIDVVYYGAGFLALGWCSWRLLHGEMSFGSLTAVIQLVNQIQSPLMNLSGLLPMYLAMLSSGERLMELDHIQGEPSPMLENPKTVYSRMESLHAEAVTFSYDRDAVLQDSSFALPKGAFAVITGPSGTGKSTILKLLLGVFPVEEGGFYLSCGEERMALDRSTRRLFAYVPQGNLLFSGTLLENLLIVNPEATEAEIQQAVYVSGMDGFLQQLPDGLDTVLGESGAGLSEGQAQRVAIARAVLGGAPILLLDECTSALDPETEQTVLSRLRELPDRTCIAVTHRPAAVSLCDWQLVMEQGKIRVIHAE